MGSPLTLTSLPNEINGMITGHACLEKDDLIALRLTCKHINASATTEFAKRYLADPYAMMTRHDLEALAGICKHPMFGPHVRNVRLSAARIHPKNIQTLSDELSLSLSHKTFAEKTKAKQEMQDCIELCYDQCAMVETGEALDILSQAFKSLTQYRNPRSMTIGRGYPYDSFGYSREARMHSDWAWEEHLKTTAQILVVSAARGGCKIKEFHMDFPVDNGIEERFLATDPDQGDIDILDIEAEIPFVFSELEIMKVPFYLPPTGTVFAHSLGKILKEAKHLRKFELWLQEDSESGESISPRSFNALDKVLKSISSDSLSRVCIGNCGVSFKNLHQLFKRHGSTLTDVRMSDVLIRHGTWRKLAQWMYQEFDALPLLCGLEVHCVQSAGSVTADGLVLAGDSRWDSYDTIKLIFPAMIVRSLFAWMFKLYSLLYVALSTFERVTYLAKEDAI